LLFLPSKQNSASERDTGIDMVEMVSSIVHMSGALRHASSANYDFQGQSAHFRALNCTK
jgi:hypothetical protein